MNILKTIIGAWGVVGIGLLLSGCINLNKTYPDIKQYALQISRSDTPLSPISGTRLKVRRLVIAPRYEGKELVYRTNDVEYRSNFYHQWFISPRAMITEQLSQWLKASRLFEHVIDVTSYMDSTHILEGTVTAMYGDVQHPSRSVAVLELQALLLKEGTTLPIIQFQKDYRQDIPLLDSSPHSLVNGWNEALHNILNLLEGDLHETLLQ